METFKFPDDTDETTNALDDSIDFDIESDDIDVEVVDDTPVEDRDRVPMQSQPEEVTEDELTEYSDKVKKRINELSRARHDERRAKETVLRERTELEVITRRLIEENKNLKRYVNTGEEVMASTLKQAAETELEAAKRKYREAHESFDTDAIVEAQDALTEARLKLEQAKTFKPNALQVDGDELYIPQTKPEASQLDEQTAKWQARNQWFGDRSNAAHREMTALAMAAHTNLVENGVDPRSSDYFERIDARMREVFPNFFGGSKRAKRPASTVVASSSRASGTGKKVVLTKTQVALAKRLGVPLELYAKQVAKQESVNG